MLQSNQACTPQLLSLCSGARDLQLLKPSCPTHPDEEVDETMFTYSGPKPTTREQAILMMADSVEAASHSLKEYTESKINEQVENIINAQLENGQFAQVPLTFKDIDTIKATFKERLKAIYHTRISYPKETQPTTPNQSTTAEQ